MLVPLREVLMTSRFMVTSRAIARLVWELRSQRGLSGFCPEPGLYQIDSRKDRGREGCRADTKTQSFINAVTTEAVKAELAKRAE
jgi:hypothetical protein